MFAVEIILVIDEWCFDWYVTSVSRRNYIWNLALHGKSLDFFYDICSCRRERYDFVLKVAEFLHKFVRGSS